MDSTPKNIAPQANPAPPPGGEPRKRRGRRFGSLTAARQAIEHVFRAVEREEMDLATAKVLIYAGSVLVSAYGGPAALDERMARLETALRKAEGQR